MKYLHLIWSNLKRKKVRTTLTFLSILIAFVLFGYTVAIKTAFDMGVSVAVSPSLAVDLYGGTVVFGEPSVFFAIGGSWMSG